MRKGCRGWKFVWVAQLLAISVSFFDIVKPLFLHFALLDQFSEEMVAPQFAVWRVHLGLIGFMLYGHITGVRIYSASVCRQDHFKVRASQ